MWIVFLSPMIFASNLLIKAPSADKYEYQVYCENSDSIRPSSLEPICKDQLPLQQYYQIATENTVTGSLDVAKNNLLQIIKLKWSCDWSAKDRSLIVDAFFRLAQLESSFEAQKTYIALAIEFDPWSVPSTKTVPPPLIEIYEAEKQKNPTVTIATNKYYDTYVKVLRNGKPFTIKENKLTFPKGIARYSFYSDSHHSITHTLDIVDLQKLNIRSEPLVIGSCKDFQTHTPKSWQQSHKLFFSQECIIDQPFHSLLDANNASFLRSHTNKGETDWRNETVPSEPSWFVRNSIWIGTVIVAGILISAEMNNRKETQTVIRPTNSSQ